MNAPLRIVLADDHQLMRAGLRALIERNAELEVVAEAADGEEACTLARLLQPDVVVMDVSMPRLSGAEATARLRRECPGVKVLALTMHEDRGHLMDVLQAGASGYVLKRGAPDELVRAIRIVAGGGTYVDPVLAGTLLQGEALGGSGTGDAAVKLSAREEEVLRRTAWGQSNKQIAAELVISVKTVETYRARVADKLGLRSRTDIVRFAVQQGWLSPG